VVAEGLAVALRVRIDRALVLAAGVAHRRASTPAGGIFALKPAVSFHPLVVVETVVGLERHDRICIFAFICLKQRQRKRNVIFQMCQFLMAGGPSAR
jgi:hypothetical protein